MGTSPFIWRSSGPRYPESLLLFSGSISSYVSSSPYRFSRSKDFGRSEEPSWPRSPSFLECGWSGLSSLFPHLTRQRLPVEQAVYIPTWVEWSILAGCISLFMLLYTLFTKVFPIVPVWESQRRQGESSCRCFRKNQVLPSRNRHLGQVSIGHSHKIRFIVRQIDM